MDWKEITIFTTTQGMDIVAGYLIANGINGLTLQDKEDFNEFLEGTTIYWDYVDESLMELKDKESNITFYLPDNITGIETFNAIKQNLEGLRKLNESVDLGRLFMEVDNVCEEDWATAWKKYYHPINIGNRLVVCPCWEEYEVKENQVKVTLDPGMAFGTGTHETTRLCMQFLDKFIMPNTNMLDIGTGSGILAITSLLLGANSATGVDIDELAVKIAHENAALNCVDDKIKLLCGDLTEKITGKYDLICANIVADVIIRLCDDVVSFMNDDSVLIVSGIIDERCDDVINALQKVNLSIDERLTENGWVSLKCTITN